LINNTKWLPFVLTLFWGTSLLSPIPVLPTETYYILFFTIAIGVINLGRTKTRIKKLEPWLLITIIYFLVVALITIDPTLFTSPLFFLIPIALVVSTFVNNEDDVLRLMLALMLMSLFLASLFLLKRNDFIQSYKSFGIDRSGWTNANMFGGCVAVGLVCAVGYILNSLQQNRNRFLNIVAITTVVITVPALILNASRGSLLAAVATSVMLLFVSKTKVSYKVLVTIVIVGFTVYLYNSGIFELLETRMGEENLETGGGRLPIWEAKFNAFGQCGIFAWIFGIGQPRLRYLGIFYSTHNDFITALIGYGAIGFILFLYFLFSPFRVAKKCKLEVLILTVVLLLEGMVLEPFFRGLLPYYMFYILLYKFSKLHS
jgi:cell division protein FtsW (lipid II flippase)